MTSDQSLSLRGVLSLGAIAVGVSLLGFPTPVSLAQNYNAAPLYDTLNLNAGFTPDPQRVNLQAGGSTNARTLNLGSDCVGHIAVSQPDVRVNYRAGSFNTLSFYVTSQVDTTLIINGPDGRWYCNDDFEGSVNPRVLFSPPRSGQYDIWVGTYHEGRTHSAQLEVSEVWRSSTSRPPPAPGPTSAPVNRQISQLERQVHDQINAYRRRRGLSPLEFDSYISQIARTHSQQMASGQVNFGHDGVQQRYDAIGQRTPYRQVAENVAWNSGYSNPVERAVEGWIDSPGHHRNLTGPYERAGVGVAINSEGAYYFTQIFMRPR